MPMKLFQYGCIVLTGIIQDQVHINNGKKHAQIVGLKEGMIEVSALYVYVYTCCYA